MHVEMPTFDMEFDVAPLLKGLPDDMTPVPQWGYVFTGSIHVTYKDGEKEIFNAGDVLSLHVKTRSLIDNVGESMRDSLSVEGSKRTSKRMFIMKPAV